MLNDLGVFTVCPGSSCGKPLRLTQRAMPPPVDWRESVFRISSSPSASITCKELCGMWLLPRTDLDPGRTNVWCDKIGSCHPDVSLTHLILDEGDGLWKLQQRQTISGQDEMLATLSCAGHPKLNDHWHLVHRCFGWRGAITMDRWTMHDYKMKITQADPSCLDELSRKLKVMQGGP